MCSDGVGGLVKRVCRRNLPSWESDKEKETGDIANEAHTGTNTILNGAPSRG